MLKFFVKRPVTTIMFVLFWVVLGIYSFPKMNIERMPPMDLPLVTATFVYPGAAPNEMESGVIERAEDAMAEISGVKKITSNIFESGGFVMAEFNLGVNVNDKAAEVKTKLDAIVSDFPADLKTPVVEKLNPLEQPVVDIAIRGASLRDLQEYASKTFSNRVTSIPGVANVSVFGGDVRAVRIFMNPELMAARGATVTDVVGALATKNMNIPGGRLENGTDSTNVRFVGEFESIKDIEDLRITTAEGENFCIRDIASVMDGARDAELGAKYNDADVVIASVVKSSDGNAIKISNELRKSFDAYRADLTNRFPGAEMEIIFDSSVPVMTETVDTIYAILLGLALTIVVLFAFTRNWRSTIIAGVVIPTSLIAGFFFMQFSGFSINGLTLLAYSSALGTLISNAIILIQAALQKMQIGMDADTAAIEGTKDVTVPILAGVGTNVVVFLPLAFMGGIAGQFMSQFGMTVVYVTLLSLMFSFTLTPMMIAKILKNKKPGDKKESQARVPTFRKWFDYCMAKPGRVILGAFGILGMSVFLMNFVGNEFSPSSDANEINITMRAVPGTTYVKSAAMADMATMKLAEFDEVKSTSAKIGERGLQNISIKVELVPRTDRSDSDKVIAQKMLPVLSEIPDAEIQIKAGESTGGMNNNDLVLHILGEDDARRDAYAARAIDIINQIEEVQSAVLANQAPGQETRFVPVQSQMNFWGINNAYAGATLRTALFGNDDYKYKEDGNEYPIIIEFDKRFKTQSMWDSVYVNSPKGLVALSELGKIETVRATPNITRVDKNRITEININIGKSTMGPVQTKIEHAMSQIDFEYGYEYKFGGMSEVQAETTGEIGAAFLLATILTFMLLAAIMNSWIHPITIATSILTSFAGVFVFMFLSGATMNIAAMLAIVMLVGLVVNNNILVLEPTIARINNGEKASSALWTEFNNKRAMILMTSIAIIAGMAPQLWSADGMKVSMGAVLCGGMTASLIWTFILTPALFLYVEKLRERFNAKKINKN